MLWYSAPSSLNNDLLNDGVILENNHETVNMERMSTPRACFMRSIRAMLERMTEWVWAPGRETNGWELGGRPDLLPENDDDEQDGDNGPKDL